jgi:glutamate/tyrosine decarboxylase-like PLP-dependent enzyme
MHYLQMEQKQNNEVNKFIHSQSCRSEGSLTATYATQPPTSTFRNHHHPAQTPRSISEDYKLEALFLGPKGENTDFLSELVQKCLNSHKETRAQWHKEEADFTNEDAKRSSSYLISRDNLRTKFDEVLQKLQEFGLPNYSSKSLANLIGDAGIPATLGMIAGMMHKANNFAFQCSTVCTVMEIEVSEGICTMLGFSNIQKSPAYQIKPWGHLVAGGTMANIEALWVSRNQKFLPISFQIALRTDERLREAKGIKVNLVNGEEKEFCALTSWELLNLEQDVVLELVHRIYDLVKHNINFKDLHSTLQSRSLRQMSLMKVYKNMDDDTIEEPVVITSGTKHFSIQKGTGLLGIGSSQLLETNVDQDGRMDLADLERILENCLNRKVPVVMVCCMLGTTELSSVDNIEGLLEVRERFRKRGLNFQIHIDAALGGYYSTLLRGDNSISSITFGSVTLPSVPLKAYVKKQLGQLKNVDSITVDPHKQGCTHYAAGYICFRNGENKNYMTYSGYALLDPAKPQIGSFGIEGSKSGGSAVGAYLQHKVLPLNKTGHGLIMASGLYFTKLLYLRLLQIDTRLPVKAPQFSCTPVPRLPSENKNMPVEEVQKEKQWLFSMIEENITVERACQNNKEFETIFNEIGPDFNVLCYGMNFVDPQTNKMNQSLKLFNQFNQEILDRCTPKLNAPMSDYKILLAGTNLEEQRLGSEFYNDYVKRAGLIDDTDEHHHFVCVLRSSIMNPWITETSCGNTLDLIESELLQVCSNVLADIDKWRTT